MWRKCKLYGPPLLLIYHLVSLYIDVPVFSGVFPFLIVIYLQLLCLFTSFGFAVSTCPLAKIWVVFNHTLVTVSPPFLHPSQGMVFQNTVDLVKKNNVKSVFPPKRTDTCLAPVYPSISGSPMTPTTCSWHSTNCSTALRCLFFPLSVSWTGDTEWQRLISAHVTECRFVHVQVFSWRTQE